MAQTKPQAPYDPVKSVVGMWNGTITRLGYFFKDPANYGEPTKAVLISTSRRYQDALDDCEIQILEAKWYLEHQLKLNKDRREAAQAEKEDSNSAKRKLAEFQEAQKNQEGTTVSQEQPAKRQRIGEDKVNDAGQEKAKQQPPGQKKTQKEIPVEEMKQKSIDLKAEPAELPTGIRTDTTVMQPVQPKEPPAKPPPAPVNTSMPTGSRPSTSYGGRGPPSQSGQNSPATAADGFNFFESMFGEASADQNDAGGLSFDNMDLASTDPMGGTGMEAGGFNDPNAFSLGDTSLNNLLPGLESYAKQSGEHGDGEGGFDFGNAGSADNEFALPDLGTSTFDDFLNDNTFGDGGGGDDFLKDSDMMNLDDLEASFFDPQTADD